jgi:Copper transport outer membrane protein, MctB
LISFRFHIVSIVAVFLALAIGIVVGSTVIDRAIVEGLRNRVDEVRDNLDERQAANDALQAQVDDLEAFANDAAAITVDGRLDDTVAVVVTDEGVDRDPVDRTIELLGQAGSTVRGVLTVDSSWVLEDPEQLAALAEVVDLDAESTVEEIQARAASLLVTDLSSSVEVVDDGTGALDEISALDLVDYEPLTDVVAPRPRRVLFVVVSGPASTLESSAHTESFAVAAAASTGAVVVAEVWREDENGPDRGDSLATILGSPTLRGQISTVDDLDLAQGPTTAILTLLAAQAGEIGHYGVGDGADAAAPPPPGPPTTTTVP